MVHCLGVAISRVLIFIPFLFFFDLFSDLLGEHEIVLILVTLGKERDLFPNFDILAGTFRMIFSIVSHELKILTSAVGLESWENAHRNVERDVFEYLLPPVNRRLERKDFLHALINGHLPKCYSAPNCA
jgi:hypothetical protein